MAQDKPISNRQFSHTSSTGGTPINLGGVQRIMIRTTADVYWDVDQPVAPTTSGRINSADTGYTVIETSGASIQNLYLQSVSSSGTAYITLIVN